MMHSKGWFLLLSLASCGAFATEVTGSNCRAVHAVLTESRTTENCTSPLGFCAAGTIEGNRGLNGTTFFVLDGAGDAPESSGGWRTSTGVQTITTAKGELVVREVAVFRFTGTPSIGILAGVYDIVSGTERFAGATGTLYLATRNENAVFTHNITGKLCLASQSGHL